MTTFEDRAAAALLALGLATTPERVRRAAGAIIEAAVAERNHVVRTMQEQCEAAVLAERARCFHVALSFRQDDASRGIANAIGSAIAIPRGKDQP